MDSKLKLAYNKIEEAFLAYEKLNLSRSHESICIVNKH